MGSIRQRSEGRRASRGIVCIVWEIRGSASALVSSTLESDRGRDQMGEAKHASPAEAVPTLLDASQGRGSGPTEGIVLEVCILRYPSALAY